MKPFYIARRNERRGSIDKHLPWVVLPVFMVGLIGSKVWPAYGHLLRLAFYVGAAAFAVYVLVILFRVPRGPINYRSLRLSDTALEYEPLCSQRFSVDWKDIETVVFCREEAIFSDPGPYLETKWFIKKQDSEEIELMDESSNRARLMRAFRDFLPGFDMAEARRGLGTRKEVRWLCFKTASRTSSAGSSLENFPR